MTDQIATYTFLPWLRQGLASTIKQNDTLGLEDGTRQRLSAQVSLQVNNDPNFASGNIQLIGPGDIIGINPQAIIRTEPRDWITDFEPNYLACVEFYDEDFLWRYTPAKAVEVDGSGTALDGTHDNTQQTKLRPWLFLMVLEEGEFDPNIARNGPLPVVTLNDDIKLEDIYPPANQSWAWAHVHVSKDITNDNTNSVKDTVDALETLVRQNSDEALSRLVCPRKLQPNTGYHAFVIPAFEVGRLAGLGQPTEGDDSLMPSWGNEQTQHPIYHQWYFRTGERGDFEYLVNLLEARPVDKRVGIRDMDMQKRSFGVDGMTDGPGDEPVMGLGGALMSPEATPRPEIWPPVNPIDHPVFLNDLANKVNLQDTLLNPPDSGNRHPDPVISPPLYGRWHALQKRMNIGNDGWVNELNQDPRTRVAAGVGAQVIQANQETYMQKAWQQLGDILKANQKIRQLQLAILVSHRMFAKYLLPLKYAQLIAITTQVHPRVLGSPSTIFQQVKASRLPQAALSPVFRRILRPRGAVMRKAVPDSKGKLTDILEQLNDGRITSAPPKQAPEKQISLDEVIPSGLPEWLRKFLASPYAFWLLLLLLVLIVGVLFQLGFPMLAIALAVFTVSTFDYLNSLRRLVQFSERFKLKNLTTESIEQIPPRSAFKLTEPGQTLPTEIAQTGISESLEGANFRTALLDLHSRFETPLPQVAEKSQLDFTNTSFKLAQALNPVYVIPQRFLSFVVMPKTFKYLRPTETIVPIMAHPVFSEPMYKPLRDISSELLIPNLNLIPNNTITLMQTNPRFIESYMVGLNHEMASELLWREYLTDQRGSYFRQFWDVNEVINRDENKDAKTLEEELRDITPLHTWGQNTSLGTHENRPLLRTGEQEESRLVLVIRGDLLKKYPTAVIFAQKAKWVDDKEDHFFPPRKIRVLDENHPEINRKDPIFKAQIDPDIRFLGFNLTASVAKGDPNPPTDEADPGNPGWFFIIQESPGEPRFGLDILNIKKDTVLKAPKTWNDLAWNHLVDGDIETIKFIDMDMETSVMDDENIKWGMNAADMAYILYQSPVMVAAHADDLLD